MVAIVYLSIGFIYALYVVMVNGGGIFSIPINTLLGPLYFPILMIMNYFKIKGWVKQRKKLRAEAEARKNAPQNSEEENAEDKSA